MFVWHQVHRVLIDIVNAAANATAGLGRYPPFKRQVLYTFLFWVHMVHIGQRKTILYS